MTLQGLHDVLGALLKQGVAPTTPVCITEAGEPAELSDIECHSGPFRDDPSPKLRGRLYGPPSMFILLGAAGAETWPEQSGMQYEWNVIDLSDALALARVERRS
ncbi:hypothetical protein RKE25_23200 (plasmid) [Dyella sp. BiH032]|uniref:hypothetical protein n=1 Tax=Dyella sp. BiH032 TaxID=3075430 RepID=UPI002892AA78|nr:hypothetical protein [Dyella sp. BiH032]WNL48591.1 hypothetical protein RKE25_23200 [Dyella sp. BiH032]